ncbi:GGDEF domain-containing protein [Candidatus Poriferisodalis sp.]|uniref:GGDEF domain-containing protein n=1 Tax=Candidatus Poriferisodalis sp. TaxID=3101277 RepID=UPI003B016BE6
MSRLVPPRLRVAAAAVVAGCGGGLWLASGLKRRIWRSDPLTGVAARDRAWRHLHAELARSARNGRVVGVAYCDVDDFKQVNDRHGHLAGDLALVTVAQCLRDAVRPSDVVARVGGDEFVVVCGGLRSADDMEAITQRLHATLAPAPGYLEDGNPLTGMDVTVSIGSAVGRGGDVTPGALLHAADRAMYRQKGRQR